MRVIKDIKRWFSFKAWKQLNNKFKEDFKSKISDNIKIQGHFEYLDNGFRTTTHAGLTEVYWLGIKEIKAYKADLDTTDEIIISIVTNHLTIIISEKTLGFFALIEKIKVIYPDSDKDWESKVIKPAFVENLTVIYSNRDTNGV